MSTPIRQLSASRLRGQTLIIAILILGVLLILGLVFASLIYRNITNAAASQRRSVATDLSEAGIRYAHYQLLNSELGADWRPNVSAMTGPLTKDPDALYLRPGSGFNVGSAAAPVTDIGGPDGLGPYARVEFDRGRALIRVRYGPGDFNVIGSPTGLLRKPGRAKAYLIIEAIGRSGKVNPNDPSTLLPQSVRVTGFTSQAQLLAELGRIKGVDSQNPNTRKQFAVASIGIIESGRFITDKQSTSRHAEIGIPTDPNSVVTGTPSGASIGGLGVTYLGAPVRPPIVMGGLIATNAGNIFGTGSLWSNADLDIHGQITAFLNVDMGDSWNVAGKINAVNSASELQITRIFYDATTGTYSNLYGGRATDTQPWRLTDRLGGGGPNGIDGDAPLSSQNNNFTTVGGIVRDGYLDADRNGFPRSSSRKEPPSMMAVDPATGLNRYLTMTRDSGKQVFGRNQGRSGYGSGVYIDSNERGNLATEDEREIDDAVKSLPTDWLNPNNPNSQGWQGPYYRPIATHIQLTPDGFEIIRDTRSRNRYWRTVNGQPTNNSRCRFVLRAINIPGRGPVNYVLNTITSPIFQTTAFPTDADFQNQGIEFNGVIYSEGDVSVRGVIPTNKQLTIVSNGSIYVNGSITKGVVTTGDFGQARGQLLSTASRSALMMMAKDYVTINTTQFFGPRPGAVARAKNASSLPDTPNPVELDINDSSSLSLGFQFLLNPFSGTPLQPSTWLPYATSYQTITGIAIVPTLMNVQAADSDDGNPAFINLQVTPHTYESPTAGVAGFFAFGRSIDFVTTDTAIDFPDHNVASPYYTTPGVIPVYGMGNPSINRLPRYETMATALWSTLPTIGRDLTATTPSGLVTTYALQDETEATIGLTAVGNLSPKNYALARTAITPFDIRIEAAMYAEEGSFFVIPGAWFNYRTDDTRELFNTQLTNFVTGGATALEALELARRDRFQNFGSMPETPFYGEPLDVCVRILGAISENMPAPIAQQAEWQRKWGWIPLRRGSTNESIPQQHVALGWNGFDQYVANFTVTYDPALATGTSDGTTPIRTKPFGPGANDLWVLPPMPRLPVSPTLMYFGETNP